MNVREDRVNELIQEISSMKRKFVDEQVTLIEDYFSNGPVGNGQGVFTMLEEYLYEINRTIGSMSFNSRMNFGIDDTVYSINKVLMELNGSDSEASLAKKLASKAKPIIADKVDSQIERAISIIRETNSKNIEIEKENKAISGITEEQRFNRTKKQKNECMNSACKDLENAIRIVKINRRPLDNIVLNNKAIKEALEPAKRYLYNLSKSAMHSMYKGIWIAAEVEKLNAQLTNQSNTLKLTTMINKKDENLIKTLCNKIRQTEAEIEFMQKKPAKKGKMQIISRTFFNDELAIEEIKL